MPELSVKTFMIPDDKVKQVVKNECYFSVHLVTTNYNILSNFYQRLVGGTSKVTLCIGLSYDDNDVRDCSGG